jgi:hypothetical protein
LALAYAGLGDSTRAVREGQEAVNLAPIVTDVLGGPNWVVRLAEVQLMVGDREGAVQQLRAVLSIPSIYSPAWIRAHPSFAAIRTDPRLDVPFRAGADAR